MTVRISRALLEQIMDCASADPAHECCGLLLGEAGRIGSILPTANVAGDPARHFEIDPVRLIAAHKAARMGGPQLIGHYHSHPSGSALPSANDAAEAGVDGALWLVVAGDQATLWRAVPRGTLHDRFQPETLLIEDAHGVASDTPSLH